MLFFTIMQYRFRARKTRPTDAILDENISEVGQPCKYLTKLFEQSLIRLQSHFLNLTPTLQQPTPVDLSYQTRFNRHIPLFLISIGPIDFFAFDICWDIRRSVRSN